MALVVKGPAQVQVKINKENHKHRGVVVAVGAILTVDAGTGAWLVDTAKVGEYVKTGNETKATEG